MLEALRAKRPINKILMAEDLGRHSGVAEVLGIAKEEDILVERVDRHALDRLSITRMHQGVLALVAAKSYADLNDIFKAAALKKEAPLLVVLDGIVDPQNLGAILRTVDGSGAHGVIIPERRAVGLTAGVARASAGAIEYVPVARVGNLSHTLTALGREKIWTIGVDPKATQDYTQVDYKQPTALVIGAEGKGLSSPVRDHCDLVVSIPMRGKVASLNASVATALVLYEALRQRRGPIAAAPHPAA